MSNQSSKAAAESKATRSNPRLVLTEAPDSPEDDNEDNQEEASNDEREEGAVSAVTSEGDEATEENEGEPKTAAERLAEKRRMKRFRFVVHPTASSARSSATDYGTDSLTAKRDTS